MMKALGFLGRFLLVVLLTTLLFALCRLFLEIR